VTTAAAELTCSSCAEAIGPGQPFVFRQKRKGQVPYPKHVLCQRSEVNERREGKRLAQVQHDLDHFDVVIDQLKRQLQRRRDACLRRMAAARAVRRLACSGCLRSLRRGDFAESLTIPRGKQHVCRRCRREAYEAKESA
jgi:hypothetical protein